MPGTLLARSSLALALSVALASPAWAQVASDPANQSATDTRHHGEGDRHAKNLDHV